MLRWDFSVLTLLLAFARVEDKKTIKKKRQIHIQKKLSKKYGFFIGINLQKYRTIFKGSCCGNRRWYE